MSRHAAAAVFRREVREILRDRRTLVASLVYGLWGPLVMGLALLSLAPTAADERLVIGVSNASSDSGLAAHLAARNVHVTPVASAADAVRGRTVAVAVELSGTYAARMSASRPAELSIWFDGAWTRSSRHAGRARALIAEYAQSLQDTRLVMRGVAPDAVRPLAVVERDASTAAGRADKPLGTLPIFLLLSVFIGGMSVAADVMAGERERGSLEALLVHPVSRWALVAGKWASVTLLALATMALTTVVAAAVLRHPRVQAIDLPVGLSLQDGLAIAGALLPLAFAAAAIQLLIALRTGSFKEAQTHLSYWMFVPMLPGFLLAFGTVEPEAWMRLTPVLGQHLMVAGILRGEVWPMPDGAALAVTTLAVALMALAATARLLGDERVLRRT